MAIRTDVDAVRAIADVDDSFIDADEDMDPFIEASNILVDWLVTKQVAASAASYSSKQLRNIETWLAAHFYCIKDAQRVREEVSTVREVFQQQVDLGLDQTRYGQMAKILDTQGWLAGLDNAQKDIKITLEAKRRVGITWVGQDYSGG